MKKILGILGLLVSVVIVAVILNRRFLSPYNIENLIHRSSLYAVISIGVAFVIVTGGIDLSIGALIGLVGVLLPMLVVEFQVPVPLAVAAVLAISAAVGLSHGLLIARLRLQPFIVTLCGFMILRGTARLVTSDVQQGFGSSFTNLRWFGGGRIYFPGIESFGIPVPAVIALVVAVAAAIFLNLTVYGRYLLALGRNELAARYSGIKTDRMIVLAYVISSTLAGLGGVLFILDINSAPPSSFGEFYELWAITAAVLGGCSLRGGEGTILGVVIGAAVLQVLRTAITISTDYQYAELLFIGIVLLAGVIVDELVKRYAALRRALRHSG
jgi:ribose transport system permease protein